MQMKFCCRQLSRNLLFVLFVQFQSYLRHFDSARFAKSTVQNRLDLREILCKIDSFLPFFRRQASFDHVAQQHPQAGIITIQIVQNAGRIQMLQRDFGHHLCDLFQRTCPAGKRNERTLIMSFQYLTRKIQQNININDNGSLSSLRLH